MAARVVMPRLSNTMEEGVILKWLKKEGDKVEWGDVIAEVETDKAIIELEVYESGILRKVLVPEGARVPVGQLIAIIGEADEDISIFLKEVKPPVEAEEVVAPPVVPPPGEEPAREITISPVARTLALAKGVDLKLVKGTGPGGRITKKDIEEYLAREAVPELRPQAYEEVPLSMMRKTIARRMAESKATIPHFYVTVEIRMDKALDLRKGLNEAEQELKISLNDLILKGVAKALAKYPEANATFAGESIRMNREINLGLAVAVEGGLITPVIRNCDSKSLLKIANESQGLTARAREKRLKPEEYSGSTFTITNLGMFDVDSFAAIIVPPQSAILAVGSVASRAVVEGDRVAVGKTMKVTLSCDHRVIDGALAAQFLNELKRLLENPWSLLLY